MWPVGCHLDHTDVECSVNYAVLCFVCVVTAVFWITAEVCSIGAGAQVQVNPATGQPDYSIQWAEYYRSLGMHREAEMIEQQAKASKVVWHVIWGIIGLYENGFMVSIRGHLMKHIVCARDYKEGVNSEKVRENL